MNRVCAGVYHFVLHVFIRKEEIFTDSGEEKRVQENIDDEYTEQKTAIDGIG